MKTFTTPFKHDPDGIDIDNNFEEQEKCMCKFSFVTDGKCDNCDKPIVSTPHQEAWETGDPFWSDLKNNYPSTYKTVVSRVNHLLTTLHKADCERFREMIGEDEHCNRVDHFSDSSCCDNKEERNMFRAELRTALSKMEEEV